LPICEFPTGLFRANRGRQELTIQRVLVYKKDC